jgi:hypothetical protein
MNENQLFSLVGDDDSGPEDVEDDLDLECETVKTITLKFFFYPPRARHCSVLEVLTFFPGVKTVSTIGVSESHGRHATPSLNRSVHPLMQTGVFNKP